MPSAIRLVYACLLLAYLLLGTGSVFGQSVAAFPWGMSLGGQINFLTPRAHAFLVRARADRSFDADYNALDKRTGGGQLQRAQVQLGFEWLLSERWSGGIIEKVSFEAGPTRVFQTGGFLRHCGHIGSVQFRKRALAEHVATSTSGGNQPSTGRIRLRADLDRTWQAGNIGLRPRLAYEIQFDIAIAKQESSGSDNQRRVDRAVVRAELGIDFSERFTLVPYIARYTTFINAIQQLNADGTVRIPAGPRNLRTPAVGVDLRFALHPGKLHVPAINRSLPTYEGFQD